jgi:hypothetical protein
MEFNEQFDIHKIPNWNEYYFEFQELDYILNKYIRKRNDRMVCNNGNSTHSDNKQCEAESQQVHNNEQFTKEENNHNGNNNNEQINLNVNKELKEAEGNIINMYENNLERVVSSSSISTKRQYSDLENKQKENLKNFRDEFQEKIKKVDEFFTLMFENLKTDFETLKTIMSSHEPANNEVDENRVIYILQLILA